MTLDANTSCDTGVNVARFLPEERDLPRGRTGAVKPLSGMPDWKGQGVLAASDFFCLIVAKVQDLL